MMTLHETEGMITRGNSLKLKKEKSTAVKLLPSVLNMCNSTPDGVVTTLTVNCFTGRFDRHCLLRRSVNRKLAYNDRI
jgi:hypothetical protein